MNRREQVQLLNENIRVLLTPVSEVEGLYEILHKISLVKLPADDETASLKLWSLLPLNVCESISGAWEKAIPAAASLHILNAAAELFVFLAVRNPAVAVNAATALVILSQRAITQFKSFGIEDDVAIHIMDTIDSCYAKASAGQHLDLTFSSEDGISEDAYLKNIYMKSACTIECACHVGALSAGADPSTVEAFRGLGRNLGMAAQVANDIQGIIEGRDVVSRKITLPVIFAFDQANETSLDILVKTYVKSRDTDIDVEQVKEILYDSGAVQYSVIKMELYKHQAQNILQGLEKSGITTDPLKVFFK